MFLDVTILVGFPGPHGALQQNFKHPGILDSGSASIELAKRRMHLEGRFGASFILRTWGMPLCCVA